MTAMAISMSPDWLDSYTEPPVAPTRPIVDPHHHRRGGSDEESAAQQAHEESQWGSS